LHGLWCVTEAKNDQQKKITLCVYTVPKRHSAENLYSYTQGKLNTYFQIWQASLFVFNRITTVKNCTQNTVLFHSRSPDGIREGKVKLRSTKLKSE
jgi:hypothetical protein